MNIQIHPQLLAVWCGLIDSGYALFDQGDSNIVRICDSIKALGITKATTDYFSLAKTDCIEVNPWYPRASDLSAICFFQNKSFSDYIQFLADCGDSEIKNSEFTEWISKAPDMIAKIQKLPGFASLLQAYTICINNRFSEISNPFRAIENRLAEYHLLSDVQIVFVPNLLQSKYLADYALVDGTLYLISAEFHEETAVHEYLHALLKSKDCIFREILQQKPFDRYCDTNKLRQFGYMADYSVTSQLHAMQELFVRVLTEVICEKNDLNRVSQNRQMGFTAFEQIQRNAQHAKTDYADLNRLLKQMAAIE